MVDKTGYRKDFVRHGHKAYFTDYGNVKIIDFKIPDKNAFRIRFLFEEDFYTLHISGDYGNLTAINYYNMNFEDFAEDYCDDIGYFAGKVRCSSRPLYVYDYDAAYDELAANEDIKDYVERTNRNFDKTIKTILYDYTAEEGVGMIGLEKLKDILGDEYEAYGVADRLGYVSTGILELYMTAYKMAMEQLGVKR